MPDTFHEVGSIDYPIIDADAHVNEPPNLWQDGVPAKWKERAPKLVEHASAATSGSSTAARRPGRSGSPRPPGRASSRSGRWGRPTRRCGRAASTPRARLADLDADGIYAQVLYPSVTLKGARVYSAERELQLACVRAYNEWLLALLRGLGRPPDRAGDPARPPGSTTPSPSSSAR